MTHAPFTPRRGLHSRAQSLVASLAVLAIVGLASCASVPPPTDWIREAELATAEADHAEAQVYAPLELRLAREKLASAKQANADGDRIQARRFAEAALVDAELATLKSQTAKRKRGVAELEATVEALGGELERTSAPRQ